jgi:hypothetical protein
MAVSVDTSEGAAPSLGTGIVFAFNPCRQEFHFAFSGMIQRPSLIRSPWLTFFSLSSTPAPRVCLAADPAGFTTPAVRIPPLLIAISGSLSSLSVSMQGRIESDSDAIDIDTLFFEGLTDGGFLKSTAVWTQRAISRGNLYLAGAITIEPIFTANMPVTIALDGNSKVGGCWAAAAAGDLLALLAVCLPCCCLPCCCCRRCGGCRCCRCSQTSGACLPPVRQLHCLAASTHPFLADRAVVGSRHHPHW